MSSSDITPHTLDEFMAAVSRDGTSLLPVPHTALGAERVQLVIRGRRFEANALTLAEYCLTLRYFFSLPVAKADGTSSGTVLQFVHEMDNENMSNSDGEQRNMCIASRLLAHYTQAVLPRLAEELQKLMLIIQQQQSSTGEDTDQGEEQLLLLQQLQALPRLPVPEAVDYDAAQHLWRITFPRRLPTTGTVTSNSNNPKADVSSTQNAQKSSSSKSGEAHTKKNDEGGEEENDPNNDPALLLQADYVGALLVFVRRAHQAHLAAAVNRTSQQQEKPLPPTLPIRWREMTSAQQLSLTQVVRALGIATLLPYFGLPTAMKEKLTTKMESRARGRQQGYSTVAALAEEEKEEGMAERDVLSVVGQLGCMMCGRAGHDSDHCPFLTHS